MRTVVDASVAAKWYFPEAGAAAAEALLLEHLAGRDELLAPGLIEAELANLLWKKTRRAECSADIARRIRALWEDDRPRLIDDRRLTSRALDLALRLQHPVYDCLYVAAAVEYDARLATADARLHALARDILGEVLLVGG